MVRGNLFGLGIDAPFGKTTCVVFKNVPSLKTIEACPSTSTYCAPPADPTLIDGTAGTAMNVYDDEDRVNFVMALPLEGENALPRPDQPAAALPVVVAPPLASPETREVGLWAEVLSESHIMTHLLANIFCNLMQKPARRRWDPEMVEKL
eukprot:9896478-Heterocapsa_arctica.AAC.1